MWHSMSNLCVVKLKMASWDTHQTYFKVQTPLKVIMHTTLLCGISLHFTHTILEIRWYMTLKRAVKVVKGMPHMWPCHQRNPKRGLVTYTRWITTKPNCYLCHTNNHGKTIYFEPNHTQYYHWVFYMILSHLKHEYPQLEAVYMHFLQAHHFTLIL